MDCEFCFAAEKNPYNMNCTECGFPIHGSEEEKKLFTETNQELKIVIDESDSALSWARFAMLWPWLGIMFVCAYYFLKPPMQLVAFFSSMTVSSIFITCYFTVNKKPAAVLSVAFFVLLFLTLFGLFNSLEYVSFNTVWAILIIPVILLIMFGNSLYLVWKVENELKKRKSENFR